MQQAEDWAASQGVRDVELSVYEFNQGAQAFYIAWDTPLSVADGVKS